MQLKRTFLFVFFVTGLMSSLTEQVHAQAQGNNAFYQTVSIGAVGLRTLGGYSVGGAFTVGGTNVTVTSLGVYDATGNGLTVDTPVAIWIGNGGTSGGTDPLLVSGTVAAGTSPSLVNGFRYVTLGNSVTLLAGTTYTIAAYYSSSDADQFMDEGNASTLNSHFTLVAADYSSSSTLGVLSEPDSSLSATPYIGPSFLIIPEPSSTLLLATGCAGLVVLLHAFRKRRPSCNVLAN